MDHRKRNKIDFSWVWAIFAGNAVVQTVILIIACSMARPETLQAIAPDIVGCMCAANIAIGFLAMVAHLIFKRRMIFMAVTLGFFFAILMAPVLYAGLAFFALQGFATSCC